MQPFFIFPVLIRLELNLLPLLLFAYFVNKGIWRSYKGVTNILRMTIEYLCLYALAAEALLSGRVEESFLLGGISLVVYAVYLVMRYVVFKDRTKGIAQYVLSLAALHTAAVIGTVVFSIHTTLMPVYALLPIGLIVIGILALYLERQEAFAFGGILLMYSVLVLLLDRLAVSPETNTYMVVMAAVFVCMAVIGRLLHKRIVSSAVRDDGSKITSIDWFTILSVIGAGILFATPGDMGRFVGSLLMAAYALAYYKRIGQKNTEDTSLTVTAAFLCLAFWMQPFFIFPVLIRLELNLLPAIVFLFFLNKAVWKSVRKGTGMILYLAVWVSVITLAIDAILSKELLDALIIGVISILILAASFIMKSKRWFVMSALTMVVLGIYMSRSFWMSLGWWIYLLIAGLALIALASANEIAKQKGSTLSKKMAKLFEDWML
jgi:hypothetical protein